MDTYTSKFWNTAQVPAVPGPIPDLGEVGSNRCSNGVGTRAAEVQSAGKVTQLQVALEFGPSPTAEGPGGRGPPLLPAEQAKGGRAKRGPARCAG